MHVELSSFDEPYINMYSVRRGILSLPRKVYRTLERVD
jgi:hypothetical protein